MLPSALTQKTQLIEGRWKGSFKNVIMNVKGFQVGQPAYTFANGRRKHVGVQVQLD
jgi:hypothetical protein